MSGSLICTRFRVTHLQSEGWVEQFVGSFFDAVDWIAENTDREWFEKGDYWRIEEAPGERLPDVADSFSAEELWMLYGLAIEQADDRERAERKTFTDCGSGPWLSLKAKLRLQIERQKPRAGQS